MPCLSVINPAQVKFFAISVLRRTKNDTVDAQIIARFCRERKPLATRPLRPIESQLKLLVHERETRVNEQTRERNRAKKDPYQIQLPNLIGQQRQCRLTQLAEQIAQLDAAIEALIASDELLKTQSRLLGCIPGIAKLTAAKLLSELAGKEFHSARQLAAYAGLPLRNAARVTPLMAKPGFAKSATPCCAKPSTYRPLWPGVGANPYSLGSLHSKAVSSTISLSAAPLCANSFTSSSASSPINNPLTPSSSLSQKTLDPKDRIYRAARPPAFYPSHPGERWINVSCDRKYGARQHLGAGRQRRHQQCPQPGSQEKDPVGG